MQVDTRVPPMRSQTTDYKVEHKVNERIEVVDVSEYINILLDYKWLFIVFITTSICLGIISSYIMMPIYSSYALVQVEEDTPSLGVFEDLMLGAGSGVDISADIQILKSELVLGPVIEKLNLDIIVKPSYFLLVGSAFARAHRSIDELAITPLGLDQYAWGGEQLFVDTFTVPSLWEGEAFTVIAKSHDQYSLLSPSGDTLFTAAVGELYRYKLNNKHWLELKVSDLQARPNTQFTLKKVNYGLTLELLSEKLIIFEKGGSSGILDITLEHQNREKARDVINAIVDSYLKQNVARKTSEQEKSLEFLEQQLPELKQKLEISEVAYNQYRKKTGSINLNAETEGLLKRVIEIDSEILVLQQKQKALRLRYKTNHPSRQVVEQQLGALVRKKNELEQQANNLPRLQQDALRLVRDVEVNTELYTKLVAVSQELSIAKAGAVGNARVIQYARAGNKPVKPQKIIVVVIAFITGVFLALISLFVIRLSKGKVVEDPSMIETLGLNIYASIPFSKHYKALGKRQGILADIDDKDLCIEAIRSLRAMLQVTMLGAINNIIMVTGASPGVGKSFLSVNMAALLAKSGKRVLLIDADLRRGTVHEYAGVKNDRGLVQLLQDNKATVVRGSSPNLYLLPRGRHINDPSELIAKANLHEILKKLSNKFDLIVIDTAPVLAVADAVLLGQHVGTILFVVKEGVSQQGEILSSYNMMVQAGVQIDGVILNGVTRVGGRYGYNYQYSYR